MAEVYSTPTHDSPEPQEVSVDTLYVLRYVLLVRVQVLLSTYRYIQYGIRSSTYSTEYVLVHTSTVCTEMVCVGERGTVCECDFDDA